MTDRVKFRVTVVAEYEVPADCYEHVTEPTDKVGMAMFDEKAFQEDPLIILDMLANLPCKVKVEPL